MAISHGTLKLADGKLPMEGAVASSVAVPPGGRTGPVFLDTLFHRLAVAATTLLLLAALALLWRRLAGALAQPLGTPALVIIAAALVAAAVALRLGLRANQPDRSAPGGLPGAMVSVAVLLTGGALSVRGTPWAGLMLFWLVVIAEEAWAWRPWLRRADRVRLVLPEIDADARGDELEESSAQASLPWKNPAEDAEEPPAEDVTQQLIRSQAADGSETLAGWLRVPLAPGQRTTNVHVAFCPPFARTPQVSVEQLDGPEARIKVVQALPYGVRCDLKLSGPCETAEDVLLRLVVRAEPSPENGLGDGSGF